MELDKFATTGITSWLTLVSGYGIMFAWFWTKRETFEDAGQWQIIRWIVHLLLAMSGCFFVLMAGGIHLAFPAENVAEKLRESRYVVIFGLALLCVPFAVLSGLWHLEYRMINELIAKHPNRLRSGSPASREPLPPSKATASDGR